MKWYTYVICFILIIVGSFCTIELVDLFSAQSGEYGSVISYNSQSNFEEFSRFDFGSIDFETENYVDYKNISVFGPQEFDGSKEDFTLFFNDQPLNNVIKTSGRINGDLTLNFYDLNGAVISTADIHFVVEYLSSGTKVTITTTNANNSVSYFNAYMELNGAVLKVLSRGA